MTMPSYYVSPEVLERFALLRQARSERTHLPTSGLPPDPDSANTASILAFEEDWRDPVGGPYAGPWLAAFEPVPVEGRLEPVRDTGWVVVVQERAGAEGGD